MITGEDRDCVSRAVEVSSNFEKLFRFKKESGTFLEIWLLVKIATHNLRFRSDYLDHGTRTNEHLLTISPRSDPLHHEFAGEVITLPSRNDREFGEYLSLMTVLCEISTSRSQENVHANQSIIISLYSSSPIPVEDAVNRSRIGQMNAGIESSLRLRLCEQKQGRLAGEIEPTISEASRDRSFVYRITRSLPIL
ncbi:hypothetical protein Tco_0448561 [Tanacetum coccineum]